MDKMNDEDLYLAMKSFFLVEKLFEDEEQKDELDGEFLKQAKEYGYVFKNNISKCYTKISESNEFRRFLKNYDFKGNSKLSATMIKKLILDQMIDTLFYLSFKREENLYNEDGLKLIYVHLMNGQLEATYADLLNHFVSHDWVQEEFNNASMVDLASIYCAQYFDGVLNENMDSVDEYKKKIQSLKTLSNVEISGAILLENDAIMKPSEGVMEGINECLALDEEAKPYLEKYFPPLNEEELTNYYENIATPYLAFHKDGFKEQMKEAGSFNYFIAYIRNYVMSLGLDNDAENIDNVWASACIFAILLAKAFCNEDLDEQISKRNMTMFMEIYAANPICKNYLELADEICDSYDSDINIDDLKRIVAVLLSMDDEGVKEDLQEAIKEMAGYGIEEFKEKNSEQLTSWNELLTWENPVMVVNLAYTFVYGYLISPIYVASSTCFINYAFLTLEVIFEESEDYEEEIY